MPMTWTPILDILADLGAATVSSLWLPALVWTIFAMPVYVGLQRCQFNVHLQYRVRQGLFFALPIGLLLGIAGPRVLDLDLFAPAVRPPPNLPVPDPPLSSSPETISSHQAFSWAWLHAFGLLTVAACAIGAYRLSRFLADILALVRFRNRGDLCKSPSVQHLTNRLADELTVHRPVRTWVTSGDIVPQTVGAFRPTIVVPKTLTDDQEALRMTLTHELVHVRRYDCLAQWVERLVASLFAIHPGVGILCRSITHFREQSCDATVLDTEACARSQYAALLYRFSASLNSRNSVALRIGDLHPSLHDRIRAMHEYPSSASRWSPLPRFAIGLLMFGLVVGIAACSDVGDKPTAPSTESITQAEKHAEVLLSGQVVDSQTGEAIPRVNIVRMYEAEEQSSHVGFGEGVATTNEDGEFAADELRPGSHKLMVSCVGYEDKTREIDVTAESPQTMTIELRRETKSLPEIEVSASDTE